MATAEPHLLDGVRETLERELRRLSTTWSMTSRGLVGERVNGAAVVGDANIQLPGEQREVSVDLHEVAAGVEVRREGDDLREGGGGPLVHRACGHTPDGVVFPLAAVEVNGRAGMEAQRLERLVET
jgi:hypothetical protein